MPEPRQSFLRSLARRLIPARWYGCLRVQFSNEARTERALGALRSQFWTQPKDAVLDYAGYQVRITDGPNFYMQCKDEFVRGIYQFQGSKSDPLIIDGGSNMGMSILAFKKQFPAARIIGFEPDPQIHALLLENIKRNNITGVTIVNAGLSGQEGTMSFAPDDQAGGQLGSSGSVTVKVDRLSKYLDQSVDFLKLNIEGQELAVLREAETAGKLKNVSQIVIEYHGWKDGEQRLGDLLNLLSQAGFRYIIHDFDAQTNPATKPPFRWTGSTWFCLVYARRP